MLKDMTIDKENRTVSVHTVPIELTITEFDLLLFLASNKGRIFTKKQIYTQVWEDEYAFDDSNIMSFFAHNRNRKKTLELINGLWYIEHKEGHLLVTGAPQDCR